jgi:hypothetical protein
MVVLVPANAERLTREEVTLVVPFGVVPEPETAVQLQLFPCGEPRTRLLELQPGNEEFPLDLLGMHYLG